MRDESRKNARFAAGLGAKKLFFIFLIGSVIGAIYEDLLYVAKVWLENGAWDFQLHRGVIYGPFNVIYGFGAVIMCLVLVSKKRKWWQTFLYAALLGGVVEFGIGWLQETFTHTTSWDYSDKFLNIGGRTTIPYMLVWGVMGVLFVRYVYPFCSHAIEQIPVRVGEALFWALLVLIAIDMLVSWTALIRQTLRHNDVPAFTPVGRWCDAYYTDEFLEHYFPNMSHHDQLKGQAK